MKREILFRAKQINSKKWINGSLIFNPENKYPVIGDVFSEYDGGIKVDNWIEKEVDPETIGQFTGLKDKNGNEIYEDDVVRLCNNNNGYFKVCFINAYVGGWVLKSYYPELDFVSLGARKQEEVEVFGNIFDNPELLTAAN